MKSSIYTRGGDTGQTSLVNGKRIGKDHLRLDLYGEVDELNSFVGVVTSLLQQMREREGSDHFKFQRPLEYLLKTQSLLFNVGSLLACEKEYYVKYQLPQIAQSDIMEMEQFIDELDESLPKLQNFILPGGSHLSAQTHCCRTICRRVERKLVLFVHEYPEQMPDLLLPWMNRLSDLLFVLARYFNFKLGKKEVIWSLN